MMFGQQCSINVVKQCFSESTFKLMDGGARLKGGGVSWYHPLGETVRYIMKHPHSTGKWGVVLYL